MEFNWRPGIGDPTLLGWFTVALYLLAAAASYAVTKLAASATENWKQERLVWRALLLLVLLLGINKQLDVQTALTEMGRYIARHQGWYDKRQNIQFAFVDAVAVAAIATFIGGMVLLRGIRWPTQIALFGGGLVLAFVVMRAASFHHMDAFISERVVGVSWEAVLEIGGILIILIGAGLRLSLTRQSP